MSVFCAKKRITSSLVLEQEGVKQENPFGYVGNGK